MIEFLEWCISKEMICLFWVVCGCVRLYVYVGYVNVGVIFVVL